MFGEFFVSAAHKDTTKRFHPFLQFIVASPHISNLVRSLHLKRYPANPDHHDLENSWKLQSSLDGDSVLPRILSALSNLRMLFLVNVELIFQERGAPPQYPLFNLDYLSFNHLMFEKSHCSATVTHRLLSLFSNIGTLRLQGSSELCNCIDTELKTPSDEVFR